MIYGYARCSTNEELQDINRQIRELIQLGAGEENIYREYESGMKNDRVELQRLLSAVEAGDTIVATEVSRITRSTKQLCEIIELSKDRHIKLVLGSFVVDCTKELDPMTEGMLKMMGVYCYIFRVQTLTFSFVVFFHNMLHTSHKVLCFSLLLNLNYVYQISLSLNNPYLSLYLTYL